MPNLALLVLFFQDLPRAVAFYGALGMTLVHEQHGKGPVHYSFSSDGLVFELYPASPKRGPSGGMRLGFEVPDLAHTRQLLQDCGFEPEPEKPGMEKPGMALCFLDPSGNTVVIENQKNP
jgi:catechol 2,3-dioxygenase-like lactoylglutathione lyase family enzyme